MQGRFKARQDDWERALFTAYHAALFERVKKLDPFQKYLASMRPKPKFDPRELVAGFEAMAARGLNIQVRRIK